MANRVTRTYVAFIRNHRQVRDDLDSLGFAASKLWNIARWTSDRIWHETGTIPDHGVLKAYLKNNERKGGPSKTGGETSFSVSIALIQK